ncbi:putative TetR family transcriptional regulator [Gordonia hirsuta DSM 44140 = NBRC 16056]|uniref:Putative TetR family transcriptional regulator n=1 Tax=Gordonia hirsuta DSM 44140 = NBRC 16056 TaxID=1121927 RepID=L7LDU7_9ACTN|nr:TetR/AcrR family transcriptional regulator [Gordonia hirsuta]GAC58242.1 putative TetR family transcriptional regulator [Gordonia hirsuta DSM 44140 = NBRC 16056]
MRKRSPRGSGGLLGDEILDAATELLIAGDGGAGVSIRAVAARVGVTPPSIYLHFADKEELLDAVCARFFEQFDDVMVAAADGIDDLTERGVAQGLAYVRFAIDNPVIFREAFARPTTEPTQTDQVLMASAFQRMRATVAEAMEAGVLPRGEVTAMVLRLWSIAHGVADLMTAKPGLPWGQDLTLAEDVLRAALTGFGQESVKSELLRRDER